jgi:hypothetical protein
MSNVQDVQCAYAETQPLLTKLMVRFSELRHEGFFFTGTLFWRYLQKVAMRYLFSPSDGDPELRPIGVKYGTIPHYFVRTS